MSKSLVGPLAEELATPLTVICNNCLAFTKWPRNWKKETVVPIPKKETPKDFNDMRPISIYVALMEQNFRMGSSRAYYARNIKKLES